MDNGTVFQSHELGHEPEVFVQTQQTPQMQATPPVSIPQTTVKNRPSFPKGNIIKIILGLLVIVLVAVVIAVVIPKILSGGNKKVNVVYWGLWEDNSIMQGVINDFQRDNPNITIEYSKQDKKQYRDRVLTRINNGNGPDIFTFHNTWLPMVSDFLLPLPSDTVSRNDFSSYYPVVQKDLVKNGAIYGLPQNIDTLGMYVNKSLFKAAGINPPTNWNDFVNDARILTVKEADGKIKTAGAAMGTFDNVNNAPDILSMLFLQNGVNLYDISSTSQNASDTLNFYTSFASPQDGVWDSFQDPSLLAFSKGNLAMYFGYSWDYFTIKQFNPSLDFEIVPVPQLPGVTKDVASYWANGVSIKSKNQKEALLFMKYLARKDVVQKLYSEEAKTRPFGELYAREDLGDTLATDPIVSTFEQQAKFASSSFFVDNTYDGGMNQQMNSYLGTAVNSVLADTSPDTATDTLSKGVAQVLSQYGK